MGEPHRGGDAVDPSTSERLSRVRQEGTEPELLVRELLSRLGLRYRVRNRDLPGSPDLANRRRRWAVFVHGCYWHHHADCRLATVPKRNRAFWARKFATNRHRDRRVTAALRRAGFCVVIVWQCQTEQPQRLQRRLERLLGDR